MNNVPLVAAGFLYWVPAPCFRRDRQASQSLPPRFHGGRLCESRGMTGEVSAMSGRAAGKLSRDTARTGRASAMKCR